MFCKKCGMQIAEDCAFCPNCGADLRPKSPEKTPEQPPVKEEPKAAPEEVEAVAEEVEAAPEDEKTDAVESAESEGPRAKKPTPKALKLALIAGVALIAVILLIVIIVNAAGGRSTDGRKTYSVYRVDDKYYISDLDGSAKEISSKAGTAAQAHVSDDGKYIFYFSNNSLYRTEVGKPDEDPVKIASGANTYHVSKDSNLVTYAVNGTLYQFNVKKDERSDALAQNVFLFYVSDDGMEFLYRTDVEEKIENPENYWETTKTVQTWYYKKGDGNVEKVAVDPDVLKFSEDLSRVVYTATVDGVTNLYVKDAGKDRERIASDVNQFFFAVGDDALKDVYFTKVAAVGYTDYYTDVYKNSTDEKIAGGVYKSGRSVIYEDGSFYYATESDGKVLLHYFDGKESVTLSSNCNGSSGLIGKLSPYVLYTERDDEKKEIYYLAIRGEKIRVKIDDPESYKLSEDETALYLIDEDRDSDGNKLYRFSLTGKPSEPEVIDTYVVRLLEVSEDGKHVVYRKGESTTLFDLYIDGEKVDTDVSEYYGCADGVYLYLKDDNLRCSTGGKGKKIEGFTPENTPDLLNGTFLLIGNGDCLYTFDGSLHLIAQDARIVRYLCDFGEQNVNRYINEQTYPISK